MLVGFLSGLFFIFNVFLIAIIVMQKNHGGFWSGPAGGESTVLFGGNQGADILQKLTWIFGIILMIGSFSLTMYYASSSQVSKFEMVVIEKDTKNNSEINNQKEDIIVPAETTKEVADILSKKTE